MEIAPTSWRGCNALYIARKMGLGVAQSAADQNFILHGRGHAQIRQGEGLALFNAIWGRFGA